MIKAKQQVRIELEARFRNLKRGDEIPLSEVADILKCDCGDVNDPHDHSHTKGYGIARRAAKFIESETNGHIVLRWDRERAAWRALVKDEIPDESTKTLKGIRRRAKSNARVATAAINDGLAGVDRDTCLVNAALSNAIYTFASRSVAKRTLKMVDQTGVGSVSEDEAIDILRGRKS